jgi:hypothetical protein
MSQKDLFELLGAPLVNPRWSWGSVRTDGVVFLRVWQDQIVKQSGSYFVRVTFGDGNSPSERERFDHVERIKGGATSFLIMCQAEDTDAVPRKVKHFNDESVFRGGKIVKILWDWWIEVGPRIGVYEVADWQNKPAA